MKEEEQAMLKEIAELKDTISQFFSSRRGITDKTEQ